MIFLAHFLCRKHVSESPGWKKYIFATMLTNKLLRNITSSVSHFCVRILKMMLRWKPNDCFQVIAEVVSFDILSFLLEYDVR